MTDEALLQAIGPAAKVGIDVPFGWPEAFVDFVVSHRAASAVAASTTADLRYRDTDRFVRSVTGRWPLSVSSDLIAVPTFRATKLISALGARGESVDRSGAGKLVEAYPAAALQRWGFESRQYKGPKGREKRARLFETLQRRSADWLKLDEAACSTCYRSDDALDALVAALLARAAARGLCEPIPAESRARAAIEGWIAVPTAGSFDGLASPQGLTVPVA